MCPSLNQSITVTNEIEHTDCPNLGHIQPLEFQMRGGPSELSGLNMWPQVLKSTCPVACSLGYVLSMLSHPVISNSLQPHGLWPTRLLCPWDFPGKSIGSPFPPPGDLSDPGIECQSPALQADSLLSKLPERPWLKSHTSTTLGSPTKLENLEFVN